MIVQHLYLGIHSNPRCNSPWPSDEPMPNTSAFKPRGFDKDGIDKVLFDPKVEFLASLHP